MMTRFRSLIGLPIWMAVCFGAAYLGSIFTTPSVTTWYPELIKPSWTPPAWVFGPVWSLLYLMMAMAAWLVWRQGSLSTRVLPITLFLVQLVLNVLWSMLFFGLRMPDLAFAEIVVLWFAILTTVITFWRSTPLAGYLLLPYLVWVAFASILNFALWRMNAGGFA
jgi:tryptophan-rich sensory protein